MMSKNITKTFSTLTTVPCRHWKKAPAYAKTIPSWRSHYLEASISKPGMFKVMQVAATPGSKQKSTANGSKWTPPGAPAMSWMTCFIFIIVKIILILIRISSQKLTPVKGCCIEILAEMGIPRCSWGSCLRREDYDANPPSQRALKFSCNVRITVLILRLGVEILSRCKDYGANPPTWGGNSP